MTSQTATIEAPIVDFCRAILGFELWPVQALILTEAYAENVKTCLLRLGRRAGKSRLAACVAVFESTVNADRHLAYAPAGERLAVVVIARNPQQRSVIHGFIRGFLARPALAPLVLRDNEDEIELTNGITIMTMPANAAAVRGFAIPVALCDEVAWWVGRDSGPLDAAEIIGGLLPGMAQFPSARLMLMSTPRWSTGFFADQIALASSGRFPDMKAWWYSTQEVNVKIPAAWYENERAKDPSNFEREYMASFTSGISATFDDALIRASVRQGPDRLPPIPGQKYLIATDPAMVSDIWSAVVAHAETSGRIIIDYVTGWRGTKGAPLGVDETLDQLALLSAAYLGAPVTTDQWSAEAVRQGLTKRGLTVSAVPWTSENRVDSVTRTRQAMYAGRLELPPNPKLLAELTSLETKPTASGRPHTSAPPGQTDDYASALLAVVAALTVDDRPGILGIYDALLSARDVAPVGAGVVAGPAGILPASARAPVLPLPEPRPDPRAQCQTGVRNNANGMERCSLTLGHRGEHVPGEAA